MAEAKTRLEAYDGRKSGYLPLNDSTASLDDWIPMHGLAADVRVRDVIRLDAGPLCYTYSDSVA